MLWLYLIPGAAYAGWTMRELCLEANPWPPRTAGHWALIVGMGGVLALLWLPLVLIEVYDAATDWLAIGRFKPVVRFPERQSRAERFARWVLRRPKQRMRNTGSLGGEFVQFQPSRAPRRPFERPHPLE